MQMYIDVSVDTNKSENIINLITKVVTVVQSIQCIEYGSNRNGQRYIVRRFELCVVSLNIQIGSNQK